MEPNDLDLWQLVGQLDPEPICVFDTGFRLIAFNRAHDDEFFRVNGFRTRIGDVFPDLFVPEQAPVMRALMARALAGEPFNVVEEFGTPLPQQLLDSIRANKVALKGPITTPVGTGFPRNRPAASTPAE